MKTLIGREVEIRQLKKISESNKSEFVVVYGRRRVGKTFLVREFFNYTFDFQLTGLANANTTQQLTNFHTTLNRHAASDLDQVPNNWLEAFQHLINYIELLKSEKRKTIFLDELPWLDTKRSDFLMALEHFWNSWATNRKDIILVTCGSAASWMINKLINNRGGLHNRVTSRIKVQPFNLKETEGFLKSRNNVLNRYQIIQLYMVMGGIPFYLEAIDPEKSAAQNIDELCFKENALLATEFNNVFKSLFNNSDKHESVVKSLAKKQIGLTRKELVQASKISSGGTLTKTLKELEESGFISRSDQFNQSTSNTRYRLNDFYSLFYLKFIHQKNTKQNGNWLNSIENATQKAWLGNAFERVCFAHIPQIKKALGIEGVVTSIYSWRSKHTDQGAQIDLLIDRKDQVVNLCEIKFSIGEFILTKSHTQNIRNKISAFQIETNTKKSIFLSMITTYGVIKNEHSQALVQNNITMDVLFN